MTPAAFISQVFQADFMQGMALCTAVFVLPLEHRPNWKVRLAVSEVVCFLLGGVLNALYDWQEAGNLFSQFWINALFQVLYFVLPLCASLLIFAVCTKLNRQDRLFGMACVYAVQHTEFCLSVIVGNYGTGPFNMSLNWILLAATMALSWLFPARKLVHNGRYLVTWRKAVIVLSLMLIMGLVLNYPFRYLPGLRENFAYPLSLAYDLCSCQFLLWLQIEQRRELNLAAAAEAERRLRIQMEDQYHLSQETIDIINRKCHDLKHQVSALRLVSNPEEREESLQELERSAMIYDCSVKTGNRVLDTVLTEKSLLCEKHQIECTWMADGRLLEFISPVDLYTLFGNALDNAIEASEQVPDADARNISVTVQKRLGAVFIQVENYFAHDLRKDKERIISTKKDARNHGFGLESIRQIAMRYGGSMDISTEDNLFTLSILLPLPD